MTKHRPYIRTIRRVYKDFPYYYIQVMQNTDTGQKVLHSCGNAKYVDSWNKAIYCLFHYLDVFYEEKMRDFLATYGVTI